MGFNVQPEDTDRQYASQVIGVQDFGLTVVKKNRALNAEDYRNGPSKPGITIITGGSPIRNSTNNVTADCSPESLSVPGRMRMN